MKDNKRFLSFENGREVFEFSLLSGLYGIILLVLFLRFNPWNIDDYLSGDSNKHVLFKTYLLSWAIFPVLGIGLTCFFKKWDVIQSIFKKKSFYPVFIFWNFLYVIFLLHPTPIIDQSQLHGGRFLLLFLLIHAAAVFSFKKVSVRGSIDFNFFNYKFSFSEFDQLYYFLVVIMGGLWLLRFNFNRSLLDPGEWGIRNLIVFFSVVFAFYFGVKPIKKTEVESSGSQKKIESKILRRIISYTVVFLLLFFFIFDTNFKYLESHYAYYLGPVTDMLGGKALLSNINAQYGVFVFYFLKAYFSYFPIGWTSFCLLVNILQVLQYFIFYFIVRQIFKGEIIPFFSLVMVLLFNHFAQMAYFSYVPSTGFLRFGFLYILMLLILLRNRYPEQKNIFLILESIAVGISFFWGFEVCFYTVPSYFIFMAYESIKIEKRIQFDWKLFGKRVFVFVVCAFLVGAYIYWDIYSKTNDWPHWSYYFDYISLYENGFGMEPINHGGYHWWIIVGILYFSFVAIFTMCLKKYQSRKEVPRELNSIFFLTIYGVFQFFYFLGRSEPNNLLHVSMPATLLTIYWLYYVKRFDPPSVPPAFKKAGFALIVIVIGTYIVPVVQIAERKVKDQWVNVPAMFRHIKAASQDIPKDDVYAVRVSKLMEKYSGNKKSLVYFFGDQDLNVSIYANRINVYPYNDFDQAGICPAVINRIKAFDPHLKVGDYIYYDPIQIRDSNNANVKCVFEKDLLNEIENNFHLEVVEKDKNIVVAKLVKS